MLSLRYDWQQRDKQRFALTCETRGKSLILKRADWGTGNYFWLLSYITFLDHLKILNESSNMSQFKFKFVVLRSLNPFYVLFSIKTIVCVNSHLD